jgi:hypothetical protein
MFFWIIGDLIYFKVNILISNLISIIHILFQLNILCDEPYLLNKNLIELTCEGEY